MTESQINTLVLAFTERVLPKSEWTHQAHLGFALWHNWNFEYSDALNLVRHKIIQYNESVGTINNDSSGYHETLTIFWMILTKNFLFDNTFRNVEEAFLEFVRSGQGSKTLPFDYYSKEVLFSIQARREWVNGDLTPISLMNVESSAKD